MMFKSSLIFLSLSAALELVWASSVTITTPAANAVWEAGSTVQIKWNVNEASSGPIRLQYASGPSKSLSVNGLIADNVTAALGEYTWRIPQDIKPKKYVIEAGPSAKDLSFAGYINIKNNRKVKTRKPKTIKTKSTTKKTKKAHSTKSVTTKKTHTKKTHTKKTITKKTHTKKTHTKKTKTGITIPKPITKKKTQTKKKTTTTSVHANNGRKPSAVCVGYPARNEGAAFSDEKVRCHSIPVVAQANKKKTTPKKTHTKKTHTKKTHTKKTHTKKTTTASTK